MSNWSLTDRMRRDLLVAMKTADKTGTEALRNTLAAIENAGSSGLDAALGLPIESSPMGAGASDAPRYLVDDAEIRRIILTEVADAESSADLYSSSGQDQRANELKAQAALLREYL